MADFESIAFGWHQQMKIELLDKLKTDLKESMRNQDTVLRDAIRQIMSEFPKLTLPITLESGKKTTRPKKNDEIENDEILDIIRGLAKSERIVLEARNDATSRYLEILTAYLPKMAEKKEIESWIRENIDISRFKSPMQAMGSIMKHFGKRADGRQVKEILQQLAGGQ